MDLRLLFTSVVIVAVVALIGPIGAKSACAAALEKVAAAVGKGSVHHQTGQDSSPGDTSTSLCASVTQGAVKDCEREAVKIRAAQTSAARVRRAAGTDSVTTNPVLRQFLQLSKQVHTARGTTGASPQGGYPRDSNPPQAAAGKWDKKQLEKMRAVLKNVLLATVQDGGDNGWPFVAKPEEDRQKFDRLSNNMRKDISEGEENI